MAAGESLTVAQLDQFEAEKKRISQMTEFDLEKDPSQIDWDIIQSSSFPSRTTSELKADWKLFCDPNYTRTPWTPEEDDLLLRTARLHHERHWDRIAAAMGNKRLPVQYLTRYQQAIKPKQAPDARETTNRSYSVKTTGSKAGATRGTASFQVALEKTSTKRRKNGTVSAVGTDASVPTQDNHNAAANSAANGANGTHGGDPAEGTAALEEGNEEVTVMAKSGVKWTPEEDDLLRDAVKKFGEKNWASVATMLGGLRTGQQCLHRWQKTLNPNIRRGRWEPSEDNLLAMAVKAYGVGNWRLIHKHVPGRTDVQCRERWVNVLDPAVKASDGWTAAEDAHLTSVVQSQPSGKWSLVAKFHNDGMLANWNKRQAAAAARAASSPLSSSSTGASPPATAPPPTLTPPPAGLGATHASSNSQVMDVDELSLSSSAPPTAAAEATIDTTQTSKPAEKAAKKPPPMRTDNQCWRRWKAIQKGVATHKPRSRATPRKNPKSTSSIADPPSDGEDLPVAAKVTAARPKRKRKAQKRLDWASDDWDELEGDDDFNDSLGRGVGYEEVRPTPTPRGTVGKRAGTSRIVPTRSKAKASSATSEPTETPPITFSRVGQTDTEDPELEEPEAKRPRLKIKLSTK